MNISLKTLTSFACLLFHSHLDLWAHDTCQVTPQVITEISSSGYTINAPGKYIFENDLTWTPSADGAAITINSIDVTLDLQGRTLTTSSSSYKTQAIKATGSENLQILNGTLVNSGVAGVECHQCSHVWIKGITVDSLAYQDVVNYTVPTGILANECLDVCIHACTVKDMNVKTGSSAAIQLTATLYSQITGCTVSNLLNQDGACTGIGHLFCDEALVDSCHIDGLTSQFIDNLNTEGHTAIGIVPVMTTNLHIESCSVSNITGCCDDAHGMSIFICDNATVKNCEVSDVLDGAGPAQKGAKATGIEVYASDVEVSECYVKNITAINPEDKQATGFSCALCSDVEFYKCKAENVQVFDENGNQNSSLGYGTGFGWAPDPRPEFISPATNIHYHHCTAKNCQVGFDAWFHIDSVWEHIHSINNGISVLNLEHSQRTLSCDACSECGCLSEGCYPVPLTVTIDNVASNNEFRHVKVSF